MAKKILQRDAPVLREIGESVNIEDIKTPKIKKILEEMKSALESQDDGVALAAPQIGHNLRIFIVSRKVKKIVKRNKGDESSVKESKELKDEVYINPVIKKLSKERRAVEEGCLSVRYLYGEVVRSHKATVEAYDEHGKKFTKGGTGLMAQIFQHEIDHLDGILFIDKAKNLEEMPPDEVALEKIDGK